MESVTALFDLVRNHPVFAAGVIAAAVVGYYLLQRKPPITRDAEKQLAALAKERAGKYDRLRPPQ